MNIILRVPKYFAVLSLIAGSIWIGSYLTRLFLVYNLFEGTDLILKNYINEQNIDGVLYTLFPAIVTHFVSFILMMVTFLLFLVTSKINLKNNGWLFIITVVSLIVLPFEVYLMTIDYKIILLLYGGSFDAGLVLTLLKDRIKDLSSFPIIAILVYMSVFYFIVFQPLTKNIKSSE
jgi:hypothetical protein